MPSETGKIRLNAPHDFLIQFLRNPGKVGAVAPSSRGLAREMVDWIDWSNVQTVVEYGPGTGVFTEAILQRIAPGGRFFAIEANPRFAETLQDRFPKVRIFHDSVSNVAALCEREGVSSIDAVICGLPWATFPEAEQTELLDATVDLLAEGAYFATFAYLQGLLLPGGQRFRRKLRPRFRKVDVSRTVWRNLPPAFVYRCRR